MVRKIREFATSIVPLAFRFSSSLTHTAAWDDDAEDESDLENHIMGTEALERLADTLGERLFMEAYRGLLEQGLKAAEWTTRYCAWTGLAQVVGACPDAISAMAVGLVGLALYTLNDANSHPRLKWAVAHALGLARVFLSLSVTLSSCLN